MAENESLDVGGAHAQRWQPVVNCVCKGNSPEAIAKSFRSALYGGLGNTRKQLLKYGISISDLLNARGDPNRLRHLLRRTKGHQYVRLFEIAAAVGQTPQQIMAHPTRAYFV